MAATNSPTVHVSDASFAAEIEQVNGLVLVDFWATGAGPARSSPRSSISWPESTPARPRSTKVDVDANQRTAMRFNVRSIPSILFFKNGRTWTR